MGTHTHNVWDVKPLTSFCKVDCSGCAFDRSWKQPYIDGAKIGKNLPRTFNDIKAIKPETWNPVRRMLGLRF